MTVRDLELVHWIGRIGAVTVDHLIARFELSRTTAYRRTAACLDERLLQRTQVLHRAPALLVATRDGLRSAGLGLKSVRISPSLAAHHEACADAVLWLEREYGPERVVSVRELIAEEHACGRAIASAKVGETIAGATQWHRPDFAVLGENGSHPIEVELTPKAPARLDRIMRAWRRAACVERVTYLCAAGATTRAVTAAIERTRCDDTVSAVSLDEVRR